MSGTAQTTKPQPAYRRWLRFNLRTLLLAMLLAAGFFAWFGEHLNRARIQRPIVAQIRAAGGEVYFQHQKTPYGMDSSQPMPGWWLTRTLQGDECNRP